MSIPQFNLVERANTGLHASLLQHLPESLRPESKILDLGCGSGAWLGRLHSVGFSNLYGLDVDIEQVGFTGAIYQSVNLNGQDWPVAGNFELITAIEVIEHLDNIGFFLENIRSRLAVGGFCMMTTPNVESLAARLRMMFKGHLKQFDEIGDPTHITPVFLTPFRRIIGAHGLEVNVLWGFPETGETLSSRRLVNWLGKLLRGVLTEAVPGDNLCLLLKKATLQQSAQP